MHSALNLVDNPWTVSSNFTERQILSVPSLPWENTPYGRPFNPRLATNEGPEQLINPKTGQSFVIYSAARSDNRNYCLGQLELTGDDPMNVQDWQKHTQGCVFYQKPREKAYGVGYASFTPSSDGSENWIVYHGMKDPSNGWGARDGRSPEICLEPGWNAKVPQTWVWALHCTQRTVKKLGVHVPVDLESVDYFDLMWFSAPGCSE